MRNGRRRPNKGEQSKGEKRGGTGGSGGCWTIKVASSSTRKNSSSRGPKSKLGAEGEFGRDEKGGGWLTAGKGEVQRDLKLSSAENVERGSAWGRTTYRPYSERDVRGGGITAH